LDKLKKEKPIIAALFQKARKQACELQYTLTQLTWYLEGYYRAEQYVRLMADNDVDSCLSWLHDAEQELTRWEADHET
jgi:hypothetical protein